MRTELTLSNEDLNHQIGVLQQLLGAARIPGELTAYRSEIEAVCEELRRQVRRNLKDLSYDHPDTFENVLRQTQRVMTELEVINAHYAGCLLRSRSDDRLALIVLRWLHDEHPKTARRAFALSDGQFAIYPDLRYPSLFFLPCSRRRTLLYLPLLFHEFGHLLYAVHRPEMDDLVHDFQEVVANVFAPTTRRQGPSAVQQDTFQAQLVLAFYSWCQEFFCDAVGLRIGGPAFLRSFVNYFRLQGAHAFYVPRDRLIQREHPVGWLRVRSLIHRAKGMGFDGVADQLDREWHETANLLHVAEDYVGTWSDELFAPLQRMLDDMLVEAAARVITEEEASATDFARTKSLVGMLNASWVCFEQDSTLYAKKELTAISSTERGCAA
ncbi:MAG: hypothetical protein IT449_07240 [Phycisphaerales bacterium]|nr:hypothetical protein [Phycisphaerales bacterium]